MSLAVNGKSFKDGAETTFRVDAYGQMSMSDSAGPGLPTQFFLTTAGDGTGVIEQNQNYAAAPVDIYYQATTQYDIHTVLIKIAGTSTFNLTDYGSIAKATIVNGVKFFVRPNGGADIPLLSGHAMTSNDDWYSITPYVVLSSFAGTSQVLSVIFKLKDEYGLPLGLNIGDRIIARLNDNFTGLLSHTFGVRGRKY